MCGIAGGFWLDDQGSLDSRMRETLNNLRHRGPDDQGVETHRLNAGVLALGHTRLSIIDLTAGGHQPMRSMDGRSSIVFNGEIYNYRELRQELGHLGHSFQTDSDTEVLLAAWRQWGRACLIRLTGMFSFVVYDSMLNTLTCVRDAFGIKPLFYTSNSKRFAFASETGALNTLIGGQKNINWQTAYDYLVHGDLDSNCDTFFAGVKKLMPGHLLSVDLASGEVGEPDRWWRAEIIQRSKLSFADATSELRERFLESLRLHLRSDVPLGAALSGGIDSSAIVCGIRHLEPDLPIKTFSYIAKDTVLSEEAWADRANERAQAIPNKVFASSVDLAKDIDDTIMAQGEPFGSLSIYAQYSVFRRAREQGITVILDGQGADELLAGYIGYPGPRARSLIEEGRIVDSLRFLANWSKWTRLPILDGIKRVAAEYGQGKVYDGMRFIQGRRKIPTWINENAFLSANVNLEFPRHLPVDSMPGRRVVAEMALSLSTRGIPALLRYEDRNAMRFSVESRVPFLTTDLATFLLSLPEEYLISQAGESKRIFRAAMRDIVPDEILDRRDKVGFAAPEFAWLRETAEKSRDTIQSGLPSAFFNRSEVAREFDLVLSGQKPFSWQLWRWLNFARWNEIFIH